MSNFDLVSEAEEKGRRLYRENEFYRNVANVMEHPEFKKFFDSHFQDWTSTQAILMFLKLYQTIEKQSSQPLSGYQKIAIVDDIIKDSDMRQEVVKRLRSWSSQNTISHTPNGPPLRLLTNDNTDCQPTVTEEITDGISNMSCNESE